MKSEIIDAYTNCIIALKDLTPEQALDILNGLRYSLIKTHIVCGVVSSYE